MSPIRARSCSRTGSRSPSIARWQIRRASSAGLILPLPFVLRVIHALSKGGSRIKGELGALGGPDMTAAVRFESYPRFIKGGFENYEGLGIKRSTADSKHVPSPRSRLLGTTPFGVSQKVVEFLELTGTSGDYSKLRP